MLLKKYMNKKRILAKKTYFFLCSLNFHFLTNIYFNYYKNKFEKSSNHIREIILSLGKYSALGSFNLKPTGSPFLLKKKKV